MCRRTAAIQVIAHHFSLNRVGHMSEDEPRDDFDPVGRRGEARLKLYCEK